MSAAFQTLPVSRRDVRLFQQRLARTVRLSLRHGADCVVGPEQLLIQVQAL